MLFEIFDKKIELPIKNIMSSCSSREDFYNTLAEREESRLFYECHVVNRKIWSDNHSWKIFMDELYEGLEFPSIVERLEYHIDSANSVTELKMIYEVLQECFAQFKMKKQEHRLLENTALRLYSKLDSFLQSPQPVDDDFSKDSHTKSQYKVYIENAMIVTLKLLNPKIYYSVDEIVYFFNNGFLPTEDYISNQNFPAKNTSRPSVDRLLKTIDREKDGVLPDKITVGRKSYYSKQILNRVVDKSPKLKKLIIPYTTKIISEDIVKVIDDTLSSLIIYVNNGNKRQGEEIIYESLANLYLPLVYAEIQRFVFQQCMNIVNQQPLLFDKSQFCDVIIEAIKYQSENVAKIISKERVLLDIERIHAFIQCMALVQTEREIVRYDFTSTATFLKRLGTIPQKELINIFELFRSSKNQLKFSNVISDFIDEYLFVESGGQKLIVRNLFKELESIFVESEAQYASAQYLKRKMYESPLNIKIPERKQKIYDEIVRICQSFNAQKYITSIKIT